MTDAGQRHLTRLSRLEWLWLDETPVAGAGVEGLRQALPDCDISRP